MSEPLPLAVGALIVGVPLAACAYSGIAAWKHEIKARASERDRLIDHVVRLKAENRQLKRRLYRSTSTSTTDPTEGNQQS